MKRSEKQSRGNPLKRHPGYKYFKRLQNSIRFGHRTIPVEVNYKGKCAVNIDENRRVTINYYG